MKQFVLFLLLFPIGLIFMGYLTKFLDWITDLAIRLKNL